MTLVVKWKIQFQLIIFKLLFNNAKINKYHVVNLFVHTYSCCFNSINKVKNIDQTEFFKR